MMNSDPSGRIERGGYQHVRINDKAKRKHQRFFFFARYASIS
jgi:hypothetical protein